MFKKEKDFCTEIFVSAGFLSVNILSLVLSIKMHTTSFDLQVNLFGTQMNENTKPGALKRI